ncbi:MAG: hypothetical protein WD276_01875 [Actinomycetota bacterium]
MPRKTRAGRDPPVPTKPGPLGGVAPDWAAAEGHEVRIVTADKIYRCPGCDHEVRRGVSHLVVVPLGDPQGRRHWHTECWRRELRRRPSR